MPRIPPRAPADRPESERAYRNWVELRELTTGNVRTLPLRAFRRVQLTGRKGDPPAPSEDYWKLEDGENSLEFRAVDDLVVLLRDRYPDDKFERYLRSERDLEAEERRAQALDSLVEILARAAVRQALEAGDGVTVGSEQPAAKHAVAESGRRTRKKHKHNQ